jgi:protein-L-isoaspartate O-methyltransferase
MTQGIHTAPDHTEATRAQWDTAADGWDARSPALKGWLTGPTGTMLELAGLREGSRVLDVAAGAGDQTLALAARVGPTGRILATDLSPALVERLGHNIAGAGIHNVEARVADAQEHLPEREQFDAAICRLGLMLMERPDKAVAAVHAALKPGGRFAAMVFAGPEANPCLRIVVATALRHAGLPPRDPFAPGSLFSLGRSGELESLFRTAGFHDLSTFSMEAPFRLSSVDDYLDFLRAAAAPVRAILSRLSPTTQEAAWQEIREQLSAYQTDQEWVGPNTLLLTVGRKGAAVQ